MVSKEKEGIRHFLKEYIVELTARDTDPSQAKNLRRKFFIERYNKKWGIPSYGKIANETIRYLIKLGKIRNVGEIEKIVAGCPFLKYYIRNFSNFEEDLKPSKVEPQLTVEDLRRIKQKEHLREVEDRLRERVVQEKVDVISEETKKRIFDLEEQKKRKEEEYYSLPSVLDESEFEEPSPQMEDKKSEEDWWHILGLREDPFPTQEGLSRIPEKLFEKVVVKTTIFQDYLDRIEKGGKDILNKGTLIIGEFGGGKTTFFDYLTVHLIDKKIKPIRLTMDPVNDLFIYRANFDTQLFHELDEFCRSRIGYNIPGSPNRESILEIMRELRQRQRWRFLIILDDLHKHCGAEDTVMKFLSSLQIFKDYLVRRHIDVGFLVSGLPNWEDYLKKEESLGGFIDSLDRIPQAEPKIAYDVIKKRMEAYAVNPEKCNAIDIKFIEKVYRKTVNEGSFRGYRTFIRHVIDEFKRGNLDILEVPIKIEPDTLESIRAIIEESEGLTKAFNKFIFGSKIEHEVNRERGLECLIRTYLSEGITEDDLFLTENHYHFEKLKNAGLIQKSRIGESQFKWRIIKELDDANKRILQKFNLSLEDYLVKLYIKTPTKREKKTLSGREKEIITKFLKKNADLLGPAVSELIKSSFGIYNEISGMEQSNFPSLLKFIDNCKRSLAYLSKALFTYEKIVKIPEQDDDVLKLWETHWMCPSSVAYFMSQLPHVFDIDSKAIKEEIATLRVDFKEAYRELFDFFKEQIELDKRVPLPLGDLTREEMEIFYDVRKKFADERTEDTKFDIIKILNENIEQKLRKFLFISLHLLYGSVDQRLKKIRDSYITEYIVDLDQKVRAHPTYNEWTYNEFENLNRGQYKLLIQDNLCVRGRIFKHVLQNFPDLSTFLEVFCEKNISTSHLKKQEVSRDEPSLVLYYILRGSDFIKRLNSTYYKFLSEYAYRKIEDSDRSYFFSLENIKESKKDKGKQKEDRRGQIYDLEKEMPKDFSELTPVRVKDEEKKRIIRQLIDLTKSNSSGFYNLNLERYDELVRLFNIEYRKLMVILGELHQEGKITTEKLYGPEIRIAFTQKR